MATAAMIIPTTAATLSRPTTVFWPFVSIPLLPLLTFTAEAAFTLTVELLDPELPPLELPLDPELPLEPPLDPPELLPELLELPSSLDG